MTPELEQDLAPLRSWIGRLASAEARADAAPLRALAATLDRDAPAEETGWPVPPLGHWLYFQPQARPGELGEDGHPLRGGFLPAVPLPRRMWAGSRVSFHEPVLTGQWLVRQSRIADVQVKLGRSGPLVFVTVHHQVLSERRLVLSEEQDIVYRAAADPTAAAAAAPVAPADPPEPHWRRRLVPDEVLLFRYSALTFNSHRIHYDRRYARTVEGYAGLVVHGPLLATLLLDSARGAAPNARPRRFSFKAHSALLDHEAVDLCGRLDDDGETTLWAVAADGRRVMSACAHLE